MAEELDRESALIALTEKIVESGSKVSGAVTIMSENLMELSDSEKRTEEKVDKVRKEIRILNQQTLDSFTTQMKIITQFIQEIKDTGIIPFIKTAKRLMFVLISSMIGGIAWIIIQGALKLYIELYLKSKGVTP